MLFVLKAVVSDLLAGAFGRAGTIWAWMRGNMLPDVIHVHFDF